MKVVFDIETDGLKATKIWILAAVDIETNKEYVFTDYDSEYPSMEEGIAFLKTCDLLIGHNIIGFDLPVLKRLYGFKPDSVKQVRDTMIWSQVLKYKRFGFGHSLEKWGQFLGQLKQEHDDWSQYSKEMLSRCVSDVRLNKAAWIHLVKELNERTHKEDLLKGIMSEHYASYFVAEANQAGWPFDIEKARNLLVTVHEELESIRGKIEPKLRMQVKNTDPKEDFKSVAYIKNGNYAARTAVWFSVDPSEGNKENIEDRPIWGDYCRVELVKPEIGSLDALRDYLYTIGWVPLEWNKVKDEKTGKIVLSTPKLDEASLEALGEEGVMISRYFSLRARVSILEGWIENAYNSDTGRIYGDCFVIGTPTFRARHLVIANIPSSEDAVLGEEIRELFYCPEGYKIIGADSAGNQNRALCHYLNNEDYTNKVIEGDIHSINADLLEAKIGSMGEGKRGKAKRFLYAILFGGGEGKLGLILTGRRDYDVGRKVKQGFLEAIPGLKKLMAGLSSTFNNSLQKTGKGYIFGLDSRLVYVDEERKCLNYLLQSAEKITCSLAIQYFWEAMEKEGINWQPLIFYHDEIQFMVDEKDAERAATIAREAFKEGPKALKVLCMDGSSKIGNNWSETH